MNAWERETVRTALALLALFKADSTRVDLDVALTARAAVLDGIALVLGDIVPSTRGRRSPNNHRVHLHLVERDPIGALGAVLRRRVRPSFARSPSELLDAASRTGTATDLWAAVGRNALLAARAWRGPATGNIGGDAAWRAVAEVAALAEAIATLDTDLTRFAADRLSDVGAMLDATAGLRVVAREALALAGRSGAPGESNDGTSREPAPAERPTRGRAGLHDAGRIEPDLSLQVRRLTAFLEQAPDLTPRHVRLCARVTRDLCMLSADAAVDPTGADLRDELGALAQALHRVAYGDRGEIAIVPTSPRVVELQLHDLHSAAQAALAAGSGLDRAEASRVTQRLPNLVSVLSAKAQAQVQNRRWAIPDRREGEHLAYALASTTEPELHPPILRHLRRVETAAEALRDRLALPAPSGAESGSRSMRTALVLLGDGHRHPTYPVRPSHPALPTRPLTPGSDRSGPSL